MFRKRTTVRPPTGRPPDPADAEDVFAAGRFQAALGLRRSGQLDSGTSPPLKVSGRAFPACDRRRRQHDRQEVPGHRRCLIQFLAYRHKATAEPDNLEEAEAPRRRPGRPHSAAGIDRADGDDRAGLGRERHRNPTDGTVSGNGSHQNAPYALVQDGRCITRDAARSLRCRSAWRLPRITGDWTGVRRSAGAHVPWLLTDPRGNTRSAEPAAGSRFRDAR